MGEVRNSKEIGAILTKMAIQLTKDQDLCRYLYYTDDEPLELSKNKPDLNGFDLLNKNILVVPQINSEDFNTASKICFIIPNANISEKNIQFKSLEVNILVYVPFKSWILNDMSLRPFVIMGRIEELLKGKRYESLGNIKYYGFTLNSIDDNMASYLMRFSLDLFN